MTRIRKRERELAEATADTCLQIARDYVRTSVSRPGRDELEIDADSLMVWSAVDGDAAGVMQELIGSVLAEYRKELGRDWRHPHAGGGVMRFDPRTARLTNAVARRVAGTLVDDALDFDTGRQWVRDHLTAAEYLYCLIEARTGRRERRHRESEWPDA